VSPQTVQHVPKEQVGEVIQSFIDNDGAVHVDCSLEQGSNPPTYSVTATFAS
jgi:hypothetical protein